MSVEAIYKAIERLEHTAMMICRYQLPTDEQIKTNTVPEDFVLTEDLRHWVREYNTAELSLVQNIQQERILRKYPPPRYDLYPGMEAQFKAAEWMRNRFSDGWSENELSDHRKFWLLALREAKVFLDSKYSAIADGADLCQ
jgi:hypothetical protein